MVIPFSEDPAGIVRRPGAASAVGGGSADGRAQDGAGVVLGTASQLLDVGWFLFGNAVVGDFVTAVTSTAPLALSTIHHHSPDQGQRSRR